MNRSPFPFEFYGVATYRDFERRDRAASRVDIRDDLLSVLAFLVRVIHEELGESFTSDFVVLEVGGHLLVYQRGVHLPVDLILKCYATCFVEMIFVRAFQWYVIVWKMTELKALSLYALLFPFKTHQKAISSEENKQFLLFPHIVALHHKQHTRNIHYKRAGIVA